MNTQYKINKYTFRYRSTFDEQKRGVYKQHLDYYAKQGGGGIRPEKIKDIRDKNIVFFGCGGVAKAVLCYMDKFFEIDPKKVVIVDWLDYREHPSVKDMLDKGATYVSADLRAKYTEFLGKLKPYDFVIDLTSQTPTLAFMKECKRLNLHYINTSIEYDEKLDFNDEAETDQEIRSCSYLKSHNDALAINGEYGANRATMVPTFGFNPGMVSIMIKMGIMFMARRHGVSDELDGLMETKNWSGMAKFLGIEVIHCSETDSTEYLNVADDKEDVFVNTWCVYSFLQEGMIDMCEFAYGSAQKKKVPEGSLRLSDRILTMRKPATSFWGESYVPGDGKIVGIVIPHSESISGPYYFGDGDYWPTMHYVYKWSPIVHRAMDRLEKKGMFKETHIINNIDDKFVGVDKVGALLLTRDGKAVWAGSILDNKTHECNLMNGTLVQVAVSVLSAMRWMVDNKDRGIVFPEALDEEYVLSLATPYLGEVFCDFVDYKPQSLQFEDLMRTREEFNGQFDGLK